MEENNLSPEPSPIKAALSGPGFKAPLAAAMAATKKVDWYGARP